MKDDTHRIFLDGRDVSHEQILLKQESVKLFYTSVVVGLIAGFCLLAGLFFTAVGKYGGFVATSDPTPGLHIETGETIKRFKVGTVFHNPDGVHRQASYQVKGDYNREFLIMKQHVRLIEPDANTQFGVFLLICSAVSGVAFVLSLIIRHYYNSMSRTYD